MESYSKSLVDKKIEEIKAGRNSYEIGLVTAVKEYILTSTRSADRKSVSPS